MTINDNVHYVFDKLTPVTSEGFRRIEQTGFPVSYLESIKFSKESHKWKRVVYVGNYTKLQMNGWNSVFVLLPNVFPTDIKKRTTLINECG